MSSLLHGNLLLFPAVPLLLSHPTSHASTLPHVLCTPRLPTLQVSEFPLGVIFGLCCLFLVAAAVAQARLAFITMQQPAGKRPSSPKPPRRGPIAGCLAGGALISSLFPGVGKRPSSATALVAPSLNDREDSDSSEKGLAGVAVNGSHISAVSPHQGMKS